MASEYYNSQYGERPAGKRRRSWVLWLLDGVLTLVTAVVALMLVLTYFVPYVNPSRVWFFPVLGLAAPITYVAGVILMLYWIIRWRWLRAGVMIFIVVVGLFKVTLFWRPDIRRTYEEAEGSNRGTIKVMTYNVRGFYGENGHSSVEDILRLIDEQDPDIICLQEFNSRLASKSEEFSLLEERYDSPGFGRTAAPDSVYEAPLAILSKFRILRSGTVLTPASSVWADLLVDDDTVRVFTVLKQG